MANDSSPTLRRRRLGAELRQLREATGLSIDDVARHLVCSVSTVSRIETGRVGVRIRDMRTLLDLYHVGDDQRREELTALAREGRQRGWWTSYSEVLSNPYAIYIGFEAEATSLRTYQSQLVPGLLQTEDYARAITQVGRLADDPDDVEKLVSVRMARQRLLEGDRPLQLWIVLDEAVIRRRIGGAEVMRAQLRRLVAVSDLPHVSIQILPFDAGEHPALDQPFVILEFPSPTDPDVVYLEHLTGSLYVEKPQDVRRYGTIFDHLRAAALSPKASAAMMSAAADEVG